MFTGTYTAIVTPFRNGELDETALKRLIQMQVKGGVDGIVPVGTTGESPTVDYDEHIHVVELSVRFAAGKIKVLAGTGAILRAKLFTLQKERRSRRRWISSGHALLQQTYTGRVV